jgi:6-phosphogluconolactonase (cycloisomerase 2 family)
MRGRNAIGIALLLALIAITLGLGRFSTDLLDFDSGSYSGRLVSIEPLAEIGDMCVWEPVSAKQITSSESTNLFAAFEDKPVFAASQDSGVTGDIVRSPVRNILDTDPIYSAVTVDTRLNEVYLQDPNTWSIRVFDRTENTPGTAPRSEAKRVIGGPKTDVQFNSCVYVDPKNGDIYSVENDIGDSIVVFANKANGDAEPLRKLNVTHRAYAMAVDEDNNEFYLSIQYPPQVAIYRKEASGNEKPKRLIQGESTRLSDSHGIAIDAKNKLMFVNNWGNISDYRTPGSGRFELPSITIYPLNADGDAQPLRVIQGPRTQLNWPGAMAVDPDRAELYVANDMGQSLIVFHETDKGDLQPARVIKGQKTGLSYPTGIFVDRKNKELWAANLGNSSATVYPLSANGDTPPLRTIRSAPKGKVSLRFGKTQAVAYDSKREEILVPN